MSDKQRALPAWMTGKQQRVKEKQPLKSSRKRKAVRSVFYCMNEQELLDAALATLTDGAGEDAPPPTHRQVKEKEDAAQKRDAASSPQRPAEVLTRPSEGSTHGSEDLDETYVSETDLDIAEMETLPYAGSPQQQAGAGGQRSGPAQGPRGRGSDGVEDREERPKTPAGAAQDDDAALKLLREIFFS